MNGATRSLESSPTRPVRCMRFWLVVREGVGRPEPMTTELADGRRTLCVFSFGEEARLFLHLGDVGGGWRVRAAGVRELVSVLSGLCGGVELVALDPLPQREAEALNGLLCADQERFAGCLLRKGSGH